jgi:hypothetical protein
MFCRYIAKLGHLPVFNIARKVERLTVRNLYADKDIWSKVTWLENFMHYNGS